MQKRNRGRIGLPRLADCVDVTGLVPAIPLSDRICDRLASPDLRCGKANLSAYGVLPSARFLISRVCALSVSLGYQAYF